jgi:hypothetical protein
MGRKLEVCTIEQQLQDEANVKELVSFITDAHEHDDMESLLLFLLTPKGTTRKSKPGLLSLSCFYRFSDIR